jgi:hypothetical protein
MRAGKLTDDPPDPEYEWYYYSDDVCVLVPIPPGFIPVID